jgi:hypothetical protein
MLPTFNPKIPDHKYPNLAAFFNNSFNFVNAYGNTSWLNIKFYIFNEEWKKKFVTLGMMNQPILDWTAKNVFASFIRVPGDKDLKEGYKEYYENDRSEKLLENFSKYKDLIEVRIKNNHHKKMIMLHFKVMHYPYLSSDLFSNKELMKQNFNNAELARLNEYYNNPNQYPEKLPFFQVMFGDKKFQSLYFKNDQYIAYATEPTANAIWKHSMDYQKDLVLIKKAYEMRLKILDNLVGQFTSYYKSIEKNTVLIIAGDHGETLGEHDYLTHGTVPYDKVTRFFYSVHFPFQNEKYIFDKQISQASLGHLVENLSLNKYKYETFLDQINLNKGDKEIVSYSCSGDIASIRMDNKFKLIYFIKSEQLQLYNLEIDPNEQHDIATLFPDIAMSLKMKIVDRLEQREFSSNGCIK